jgi:hypothetical protein
MSTYIPTRLYIKQHTITGLRYFGKSIKYDIDEYHGSGTYWKRHINKHGKDHIITEWMSDWFHNEKEIKEFALAFSEIFDIVNSKEWTNLKEENGMEGGSMGSIIALEAARKRAVTTSDPKWKESTGKEMAKKQARKISETMNDPRWKESTGKNQIKKHSETMNSSQWRESIGKEMARKNSETKNNPIWKALHTKTCEHCHKITSSANYSRWHGIRCKIKPL